MKHWLMAAAVLLGVSVAPAYADYLVIVIDLAKKTDTALPGPMEPGAQPMPPSRPMPPGYGEPPRRGGQPGRPMGGSGYPPMGYPPMGGGMPPQSGETAVDFDAPPMYVTVVVEINQKFNQYQLQMFPAPPKGRGLPIDFTGRWGKAKMVSELEDIQVIHIPNLDRNSLFGRYTDLKDNASPKGTKDNPEKPKSSDVLVFADWCLKHGLLTGQANVPVAFKEIMDQFLVDEPKHPAAVAYQHVKHDLGQSTKNPPANTTRAALLQGYKMVTDADCPHYIAYHKESTDEPAEVKRRLVRLEKTFQSFYYWYALRGVVLPIPTERQPVVVAFNEKEYNQFKEQATATMEVADGFVGRREGLAVFSAKRLDVPYLTLEKKANVYWTKGVNRAALLTKPDTAIPKELPDAQSLVAKVYLAELALLQSVAESDAERASITHNGTRQLLYASGLLPSTVAAPEWLQFGMGSCFETPMGSPYVSMGMPSNHYLPLWKAMRKLKQLSKTKEHPDYDPVETLRQVVTDNYFRQAQQDGSLSSMRRARASSWALVYFLLQYNKLEGQKTNLEGLQRYFQEMAKMPRDRELGDKVLLTTFCKAFNLQDANYAADPAKSPKFQEFAIKWDTFLDQEQLELQNIVKEVLKVTLKYDDDPKDADKVKVTDSHLGPQYGGPFHPSSPNETSIQGPGYRPGGEPMGQPYPGKGPGVPPEAGGNASRR